LIARKALEINDLSFAGTATYGNGEPLPAVISSAPGKTGLGEIEVLYDGAPDVPVDVGTYRVTVAGMAAGQNYEELESSGAFELGAYTIMQRMPAPADFVYAIPEADTATGFPQGIGEVSLKGTGYGALRVLYGDSEDLPSDTGSYTVYADVEGGLNYIGGIIALGTYRIHDPSELPVSVAASAREIPGAREESAAAAPASARLSAEFSVGPNPAAAPGGITFFWNGAAIERGVLGVYDASGNLAGRVRVAEKPFAGSVAGRREIGVWDMVDVRGRQAAGGAYLVKGVLRVRDGSAVNVRCLVGVIGVR
jgi:hypothetical protein